MPSEAAKRRKEKKKGQSKGKPASSSTPATNGNGKENDVLENGMNDLKISERACTGVLASHPEARDLHINQLSITFHGVEILVDTKLELNCGRRYGLIGQNGCGNKKVLQINCAGRQCASAAMRIPE